MRKFWRIRLPSTLKYRLVLAFIVFLLVPLCLAVYSLFRNFETIRQDDMVERVSERMQQVSTSLTDMMAFAYKTHTMLSQDESLVRMMTSPEQYDPIERKRIIESKMFGINNSFFFHQTELYFKLIDHQGNVYTSYSPNGMLTNSLDDYRQWKTSLEQSPFAYKWVVDDVNDLYNNKGDKLLSLYILLSGSRTGTYGLARISINVQEWFDSTVKNIASNQELAVFTGAGELMLHSKGAEPGVELLRRVQQENRSEGSFRDGANWLVNYGYMDELDWYVVNRVALHDLWAQLSRLRGQFFAYVAVIVALFVAATFGIAAKVTKPLRQLQQTMKEATARRLNVRIDVQSGASEEVVSFSESFNRMIDDIVHLIRKLREEEKQKQAVRFQMLLSQMNPHFLLNTLNTVKWMARREKQANIFEICVSLGGLLEASLNTELELVPLEQELQLIRSYESIQKYRYRDRFEVLYEIGEGIDYALVPKLSLQPLVENAILHGFNREDMKGTIRIRAHAGNGCLLLEVEDDGIGLEEAARKPKRSGGHGIGLSNLRERLQLLYKDEGSLTFSAVERGTLVTLKVPLLIATPFMKGETGNVDDLSGRG